MKHGRNDSKPTITFTLTKAGGKESSPVELTGREFDELGKMSRKRPKLGPPTKAQAETQSLLGEFVRRGLVARDVRESGEEG